MSDDAPVRDPVVMLLAESFSFQSKSLHQAFRIWVSRPLQPAPRQGHATLYLLDGRSYFHGMTEMARIMSVSLEIAPLVVVGIGYDDATFEAQVKRRTHDLTISQGSALATQSAQGERTGTGGAPAFLRFLQQELKPLVRRRYQTDASREVLMGHSLGGLTSLYAALTSPADYFGYVASSPAILADQDAVAQALELCAARARPARLYLGAGEHESHEPFRIAGSVEALSTTLSSERFAHLDVVCRILPYETHATAVYAVASQSLRWVLRDVPVDHEFDIAKFRASGTLERP